MKLEASVNFHLWSCVVGPSCPESINKGRFSLKLLGFDDELEQKNLTSWAPVAHICNPSYSGGREQEDHGSKLAWENK
jgi:hypothetical protein